MLQVGYGHSDITPRQPVPLSGFAARCGAPFKGIDDPLHVRALAVQGDQETVLLMVFDLLALGEELHGRILSALAAATAGTRKPVKPILCATHTHSAAAAITLLGCGDVSPGYWDQLIPAAVAAARQALAGLRPARLRYVALPLDGESYNRRRVLEDGRVVMAMKPDGRVRRTGAVLDRMLLLRFDDPAGKGIAGLAHWAAHPVTVCGPNVTADYPGELCRRLSERHGIPFLYLQGAAGNINPVFEEMTRRQMLANVDSVMGKLGAVRWPEPVSDDAVRTAERTISLDYGPFEPKETLRAMRDGMAAIAETGDGPEEQTRTLADILNVRPGAPLPRDMARYIASILRQWSSELLDAPPDALPTSRDLALAVWRIGPIHLCFVAAELFAEIAMEVQQALPDHEVHVAAYASPLVGYLPTDEALVEGGYEAAYAYRFYDHPAPFAKGSAAKVVQALQTMISEL
jgi:hypothetical protein